MRSIRQINWLAAISATLIVVLISAAVLLMMGRVPWCQYGGPWWWSGEVFSRHNSQHLFDAYTFTHLIHGIAFFWLLWLVAKKWPMSLGFRFLLAATIGWVWEIWENTEFIINRYRIATISLDYYGDSVLNSVGDIAACLFAFYLAAILPWRVSIFIIILIEILLAYFIRDNLFLNIVMLIYPVQAIKVWQSGG